MLLSNLLTRYILASFWVRLLIFLIIYIIIRKLHFIDSGFGIAAECMPRKKEIPFPTLSPSQNIEQFRKALKAEIGLAKDTPLSISETKENFKSSIPAIAESKDNTIQRLEKEVKDLTAERNGLRKNVSKVMKDSKHSLQIRDAEIQKLKKAMQELRSNLIVPEAKGISLPVIPHAEPVAEVVSTDTTAISLEGENMRLSAELQETIYNRQLLLQQMVEEHSLRKNLVAENNLLRTQIQELSISRQNIIQQTREENKELCKTVASLEAKNRELRSEIERLQTKMTEEIPDVKRSMLNRYEKELALCNKRLDEQKVVIKDLESKNEDLRKQVIKFKKFH